jgi:type VI secretion system VasD/TssJ family lipoprotein
MFTKKKIESMAAKPNTAESKSPPPVAEAPKAEAVKASEEFKKDDITVLIKADHQLNRYQNKAHTLLLCIYQLKDPNSFNQLVEEKDGISRLMECSRFDPSVANAKRMVIQPGQELKDKRDRAEGVRYVGIATGYYGMRKHKVTQLLPFAANREGKGSSAVIRIELGSHEIGNVMIQ